MTPDFIEFSIGDPATWRAFVEKLTRQRGMKRHPDKDAPPPYGVQAEQDGLPLDDLIGAGLAACAESYAHWRRDPSRIRKPKGYVATAVLHAFENALLAERRKMQPPDTTDAVQEFLNALAEVNTRAALAASQGLAALSKREREVLLYRRVIGESQESLAARFERDVRTIRRWERAGEERFVHAAWAAWRRLFDADGHYAGSDETYSRYEARVLLSERLSQSGLLSHWLPNDHHGELSPVAGGRPGVQRPKPSGGWYSDRLAGQIDVAKALEHLPVSHQQLLRLWHWGYSENQIADFLGQEPSVVSDSLRSAETKLLEILNGVHTGAEAPSCPPRSLRVVAGENRKRRPGRRRGKPDKSVSSEAASAAMRELLARYGERLNTSRRTSGGWISIAACLRCEARRGKASVHASTGIYHCFKCHLHGNADQIQAQLGVPAP